MTEETAATTNGSAPSRELALRKIYIKDLSFDSPSSPDVFQTTEFRPQTDLNLRTSQKKLDEGVYESVLSITIDAKVGDETAFLIELHQAGVFLINGFSDEEMTALLGSWCPSTLFPYARETVSSLAHRGGFPDLALQPIDFDTLFRQSLAQQQAQAQAEQAAGNA